MIKKLLIISYIISTASIINAQDISSFLKSVAENNPEILAYRKLLEAKKTEARINLTPSDPFVSFGYMPGTTSAIGIKKTWSVNQAFAFPTKYLLQKKLNRTTIILAEQEYNYGILLTLLEAKLDLFDMIYCTKRLKVLSTRKELYSRLQAAWKKMLDTGEATIMEYNKITLELSSVELQINRLEADIRNITAKLSFMNGMKIPIPSDIDYPVNTDTDPNALISEKNTAHPAFLLPETEFLISLGEVRLSRSAVLPELQIGYASETIPGETYIGPTAGLSIPLWSNSFRIKTAVAKSAQSAAARDAEILRLKSEVSREFDNSVSLKKSLDELNSMFKSNGDTKYLDIALNNSEISLTEYFSYLTVFWQVTDKLLEIENEYNKSQAKLHDHELLK